MTGVLITADAQLESMILVAREAAKRAAECYAEHLRSGIEVEEKSPGDPVTRVDRELDAFISGELRERFPEAGLVGEESVPSGDALAAELARDDVFFVDPIDGTREFVAKNGEFAVMIGLARCGRASAGVVALPSEGLIFAGRIGQRAFVEARDGSRRFAVVSPAARFEEARMVVSRSHEPALVGPLRRRLGIGKFIPCGSVGVKVARLVEGNAELYVHGGHGLSLWDTCAPEAVLGAAGGRFSDLDGRALDYRGPTGLTRGLVASNGALHPGVMSALAWAEREVRRVERSS